MFVTLVPGFSIGREVTQPPRGHLAMTGDIFGSHTWEGGLLASSGLRSGMLLNILWYTMQPPLQGTAWPRTSVPRMRRPARAQGSTHPHSLPRGGTTVPLRFLNLESRLQSEVMDCFLFKQPPHWHQLAQWLSLEFSIQGFSMWGKKDSSRLTFVDPRRGLGCQWLKLWAVIPPYQQVHLHPEPKFCGWSAGRLCCSELPVRSPKEGVHTRLGPHRGTTSLAFQCCRPSVHPDILLKKQLQGGWHNQPLPPASLFFLPTACSLPCHSLLFFLSFFLFSLKQS